MYATMGNMICKSSSRRKLMDNALYVVTYFILDNVRQITHIMSIMLKLQHVEGRNKMKTTTVNESKNRK